MAEQEVWEKAVFPARQEDLAVVVVVLWAVEQAVDIPVVVAEHGQDIAVQTGDTEVVDRSGRPLRLLERDEPIRELISG